jgi:transposase
MPQYGARHTSTLEALVMTNTTIIGMDISKYSFELCGTDERGRHTLHRRLHRDKVSLFFANLPACTVAMESCSGSQHWARQLKELGHQVRLIPAQHVVAFRQGAKNDRNDAAAIAEAATRPNLRTVPVKSTDQQDLQTLHRVRERLVHHRTALINEIRGLLLEYGIVCAKGMTRFLIWLRAEFAADIATLSPMAQETFQALRDEFRMLDERLALLNKRITAVFDSHLVCQQLATIPASARSSPPLSALRSVSRSALRTDGSSRPTSDLCPVSIRPAASPNCSASAKQAIDICECRSSTARSTIYHHRAKEDPRSRWVAKLVERRGFHKANIALANKNARVVWKLLTTPGERFSLPLAA